MCLTICQQVPSSCTPFTIFLCSPIRMKGTTIKVGEKVNPLSPFRFLNARKLFWEVKPFPNPGSAVAPIEYQFLGGRSESDTPSTKPTCSSSSSQRLSCSKACVQDVNTTACANWMRPVPECVCAFKCLYVFACLSLPLCPTRAQCWHT